MTQANLSFAIDDWMADLPATPDEDPDGLRWYQRDAYDATMAGFAEGYKSLMVVLATGLGKTELFTALAKHWDRGDILILTHRDEIGSQASARYTKMTGDYCEVEQGSNHSSKYAHVVVGSVQSFNKRRLERLGRNRFGLIVADEIHNFLAPTFRRALEWFDCPRYGTTATPDRGDGKALAAIVDRVVYSMGIEDGIEEGYLVPLVGQSVRLDEVDLSDVGTAKVQGENDLDQGQLDDTMLRACEGIVRETLRLYPERQGIAFFPGVKSAAYAAEKFNALRPDSACFISGDTDPVERRRLVAEFRNGRYRYLTNCQVATEGFDAPGSDLIIQGRPTKSRKLYAQTVGRGTRVLPNTVEHLARREQSAERRAAVAASAKPNCVILDFVGNAGKHSLVTPEDLLGGRFTDEEREHARKKRASGDASDVTSSLRQARLELAAKAKRTTAKVKSTVAAFNPFAVFGQSDVNDKYVMKFGEQGPSEWMVGRMQQLGLSSTEIHGMNRRGAQAFLDDASRRQMKSLASYKQMKVLARFGVTASDLSFSRASEAISWLSKRGWGAKGKIDPKAFEAFVFGARAAGEEG